MAQSADVVIIGGGVIGCAAAYELAGAGLSVIVLERGRIGGEASSASAGLLVPLHSAEEGRRTPLFDLYWASSRLFPDLVSELEGTTGVRMDYDPSGSVRVATSEDEEELLRESFEGWNSLGELSVAWLDRDAIHELEPALGPDIRCAVVSEDEQSLHPGRLTEALARAAALRGADVRTFCPAIGVRHRDGRFEAVETPDGEVEARELVIAAGAWSRVPCGWFGVDVPISPARGQMVEVRPSVPVVRHSIFCYEGSVLPKLDGSIQSGSTVELVGFDSSTTPEGMAIVLSIMPRLVPSLGSAPIERIWAGLRPWCEDGIPAIGRLPGCEGVTLASGHFKMGIIGSAMTARGVRDLIVDDRIDPLVAPFSPERFAEDGR